MNDIIVSTDIQRANYERIVEQTAKAVGLQPEQFKTKYKVFPSILKLAAYLDPAKSSYDLFVRKGANDVQIPNSILLDQNDFFGIDGIGLRIGRAAYASGLYSNHGNYPVMTYPDPAYFNGTGSAVGSEITSLQTLVNGTTAIKINDDGLVDGILSQDLFYNPEATYTSSPLAYPRFGGSDGDRGIFKLTPQIILDASADNKVVVTVANGAKANIDGAISTGTTDSGTRNLLYVILYGWKIKNLAGTGDMCPRV